MGDFTAPVLLAAVLLYLGWTVWRGRDWAARIAALRERSVAYAYHRWALALWVGYGLPAGFGMILLGRDLLAMPPEFAGFVPDLPGFPGTGTIFLAAMLAGMALNLAIALRRRRLGKAPKRIEAFILPKPRRLRDTPPALILSLSAGVSEELFFRQLLPLLIVLVSGSVFLAIGASALLFALIHGYQPIRQRIGVGITALLFSVLYLGSGSLWIAIAFHVLIDVNRLVIDPIALWPLKPEPPARD